MKKMWRIYKYIAITVFSIVLLDVIVVLFFSFYRPTIKKADAIVILGSAINTPSLDNRSLQGLKLYRAGDAPLLVLSGGQDYPKAQTEAGYMKKVIDANSQTPVPVILEDQSHSTYDNLKNTKAKIGEGKSIIIVSDNYHLARGVLMAEREGFSKVYWSSPSSSYNTTTEQVFYYAREVLAMLDYIPKFIFG